jgi:DNA repair protein RecO (recombination protein O)
VAIHYRTIGFVFKKEDRFEADRAFAVFTYDFGRLEIVARAIRKITSKLKAGIEIFSLSEIEFIQGKTHKTLTDAITIENFNNVTQDLNRLEISYRISEVLDNFIKGQEKDEDIWNLIIETFEKINSCSLLSVHCSLFYYYFLWNFLSVLGYQPELFKCALCQNKLNPYELYFSHKEGGIICKTCSIHQPAEKKDIKKITPMQTHSYPEQSRRINSDVVKILRLILKKDWQILSKLKIEPSSQKLLKEISDNYYFHLLSSLSFNENLS